MKNYEKKHRHKLTITEAVHYTGYMILMDKYHKYKCKRGWAQF